MSTQLAAYSYIRFSSGKQAKGDSLRRQTSLSDSLVKNNGWKLDTTLKISDLGKSAFKGELPGLTAFIQAIEEGRVAKGSILIIEKLDRVNRQGALEGVNLVQKIIAAGVVIYTTEPEKRYDKTSLKNLGTLLEMIIIFALANEESQKKSDRARHVWDWRRNTNWMGGTIPAWLKNVGTAKEPKLVIDEKKAVVVRKIFEMSISGMGNRIIASKLTADGVANIACGQKEHIGKKWRHGYIQQILTNKAACGLVQRCKRDGNKRKPVGDELELYPAVVSVAIYLKAQRAMNSRKRCGGKAKRATTVINIFEGLIFDKQTNTTLKLMNGSAADHKRGITRRLSNWPNPNSGSIPLNELEEKFLGVLAFEFNSAKLAPPKLFVARLPGLEAKLDYTQKQINKLKDLILDSEDDDIADTLKKLVAQKRLLKAEIDQEKSNKSYRQEKPQDELLALLAATPATKMLSKSDGDELEKLRYRIRGLVAQLVNRIDVTFETLGSRFKKRVTVVVKLHSEKEITFCLCSVKGRAVNLLDPKQYKKWNVA